MVSSIINVDKRMMRSNLIVQLPLLSGPGLKPGWVIWVIWVTFYQDQAGLTCFIKYPGLTQILDWITCIENGYWM